MSNVPWKQRMVWVGRATFVLALGSGAGCETPSHTCERNASCDLVPGGDCDPERRRCVYPDDACESGARFSQFAGKHAGQCRTAPALDENTAIANRIETDVVLDGDPSELKLGAPLRIDSEFGVRGRVWLRWNDNSLFIAAEVEDPMLEATIANEGTLWDDDSLEIMFDTAWDRASGTLPKSDDFKFVATALNATGVSWGGFRPAIAWDTPVRSAAAIDGTLNQRTDADVGYQLEIEIPWTEAFPKPAAGVAWGMNLQLNDRHDGARRSLRWLGGDVGFNQPVGAVVLAFADGAPPTQLRASGVEPSDLPPFERLDLAVALHSTSENFSKRMAAERLFDGCTATMESCSAGTKPGQTNLRFEFDLKHPTDLAAVRLFGNTKHQWQSKSWTIRHRLNENDPWVVAFEGRSALFDRWTFEPLAGVRARYVELHVEGGPNGVTVRELELYGRTEPD